MASRANGKGYLKLSLVPCAVALFPATTTRDRVRFNVINRETGNRVRYVVDADTGRKFHRRRGSRDARSMARACARISHRVRSFGRSRP